MSESQRQPIHPSEASVLGLGAMGSALAAALLDAGRSVTVWNRTPGRATRLVAHGADAVGSVREAVLASPVVIACLLDHASVEETLGPVAEDLRGRTLVNVTTTTPGEARELASWAAVHGIDYLDGAIMAVPSMIGAHTGQVLYSGSRAAYETLLPMLEVWATSEFFGEDAGRASVVDLAMLSGMYQMFAGFFHGAAMAATMGMSAAEFTARQTPFLAAMTEELADYAKVIDGGDYTVPGQQSLDFSDLSHLVRASEEEGVDPSPIAMVQELISRQVAAGHGSEGFARVYESLRADR
ncbi:3-hydroxyisobutyrate dehydrogenase-like beta-hydroxyacid dehydrogenase [Nocardioides luteus]|uniref:NAD(P)-dependent oxidoreductase n=1 Tax=Nocardioides luteus TaxID=1844 RepID=UPI001E37334A|nr:NAD(P)-binding domain-containing protein [Nocardioides luteus]MDR7309406.1 3-hydroxyisobutyrate dehydrogenase-like beta-hydroxyacid dehydrogenase [Nocardioides luteus]